MQPSMCYCMQPASNIYSVGVRGHFLRRPAEVIEDSEIAFLEYNVPSTISAGARELEAPPRVWVWGPSPENLNFFYIKMACSGAL